MESIKKLVPFTSRFTPMMDRERLKRKGIAPETIEEEAAEAKSLLPRPSEEGDHVPEWVVRFLSNPAVKPGSVEELRKVLSKLKTPLSDAVIEDRYGVDSR